ncbi:serine/threonine-protein kinase [Methanoculleus sp. UBA291]|jgi:serine/threonine protein kinase|uniref:serine/threonine protein kinase n=1 Tax=Methanoculleus sp. UBA291 TaxID=1915495 RepID=UPI00316AC3E6
MKVYKKLRRIGGGGFGEVFEASDDSGNICAIKFLKPGSESEEIARFQREVRLQSTLSHKNIVSILDSNIVYEPYYFTMPLAKCSLREYLHHHHGESCLWVISQIADALRHAHSQGVIHRDLKPENVLIFDSESDGVFAAVGDFGLGRFLQRDTSSITLTNMGMGTSGYMSPEQYKDAKNVNHLSDIYSLGALLYEVLAGEPYFIDKDVAKLPPKYRFIVQKACKTKIEDRYQSVEDFVRDLKIFQEGALSPKTIDEIESLLRQLSDSGDYSKESVKSIIYALLENIKDDELLVRIFPKLPDPILKEFIQNYPEMFATLFKAYDDSIDCSLEYSYCDVVASFYHKVFYMDVSLYIKEIILERLPILGANHSRWYVGDVFADIVSGLDDEYLIIKVRTFLQSRPNVAEWCQYYLDKPRIPKMIRELHDE